LIDKYLEYFKNNIECWRILCEKVIINVELIDKYSHIFINDI